MLRKLAALALLVGLCLPYAHGVRPIMAAWKGLPTILLVGFPLIAALVYGAHTLLPPFARFHERHARAIHAILRLVYFGLVGGYLALAVTRRAGWPDPIDVAVALVVTGILEVWHQRRGTMAARLPLLSLTVVGVPAVAVLVATLRAGAVDYGGWVVTASWVLGVVAEAQVLGG